ncbi:nuclear transport factor 2 family protein [Colwellia psychrerythraea]|uniref:Nuclear transport factor 2 family protein n=1 Tax=Colwellia psychrerythraea TaxID=28229 RepID=A0A099KJQ6_COLPS|nr:nuclear transport factor 2 family protein [Colwellia psychrerythraea]KGJ89838.1 hypothetical protein GAB14E_3716 [Colwellia psychrerythraea]
MKFFYKVGLVITSLFLSNIALAANCDSACQLIQIKSYFSALDEVGRKGSTIKDIDSLLAMVHKDVKYIHVEYQANFTKESWREAFIRNLNRGSYQKTKNNEARVINTIFGKNHVAVEYAHGVINSDGTWKKNDARLALFGFKDGKILLIKELW